MRHLDSSWNHLPIVLIQKQLGMSPRDLPTKLGIEIDADKWKI